MALRDILVHLDAGPAAPARLDLALSLARRLGAEPIGLFVAEVALPVFAGGEFAGGAMLAELIASQREAAIAAGVEVEAMFRAALHREGCQGEWRLVEGTLPRQIALHGRHADLVILGQPSPAAGAQDGAAIEAALFDTGRPVLIVPYAGTPAAPGRRVLVGWNASREAARAVHDALPLMAGAEVVTILTINAAPGPDGHGEEPGADIARHLARHGLPVTVRRVIGEEIGAGDLLLNEAADLGADLIVMGGYGHSRLRELVLGGATRTLLRQMTVPVLMSH